MDAAVVLMILRNDHLAVSAQGGKVNLRPKNSVTDYHRRLVREHRAGLLLELAKWPNGEAPARSFRLEPPRRDEMGMERSRPRVIMGRRR